ncbi:MAG TPA: molybdopterin cofactor-binding domain-containing protein [Thermoanaerobaculia bacterium]|nr:molybdopterin cofactor-binding domain-containing protein [Thermoanaerobaculia bacterium]
MKVIGKPRRRVDARAKVTGRTQFADDLSFPRMLHCKILRSRHPHARLLRVDTARALTAPGVKIVLTGADFPIRFGILPVSQDEEPLCRERVRMIGDPIAAVIASTEAEASAAIDLIDVEYEVLPTISDPAEALAVEEPRIHDYGDHGNVHKAVALEFGDVDSALAASDRVFEDLFFYAGSTHLALEQHAAVALLDPDGKLTLYSSTQTPHYVHRALSKALDLEPHRIRVIATPNGGGFGGKTDPFAHEIVVAKAAMMTGRPVKIALTREEVFHCHRGRHPVLMRMRTGVKKDGSLVAMDLETLLDGGAYGSYGVASTFYTGALQTVTYDLPRYRFRGCRVFTNKPPCGPKRGHGTPQPRFGQEIQLDKIAVALGRDPADLRLQQIAAPHSITANWMQLGTIGLRSCIEKVVDGSGWRAKWQKMSRGRGVGLACSSYLCGAGLPIYWNELPHSAVQLKLDRSGLVTIFCGSTEVGQGSDDVLAGIVSEILGVDPFAIRLVTGDTDLTPVDLGSYSSRVTVMAGNAAVEASERAKTMIAGAVSAKLGIPEERLVFAENRVFDAEDPGQGLSFRDAILVAEAACGTLSAIGSYKPPRPRAKYKGGGVGPSPSYSYSAAVAEVEVDPGTGWLRVANVWIAHDIGRSLNPVQVRGQVEGGVYMGLGEALMEETAMRRLPSRLSHALVHRTPSMLDYKSLTALEMPEITVYLVEEPDPAGPFGAKEVGQGPLLPIAPAIANAVFDAVGVRIDEVPITPEKILRALKEPDHRVGPMEFPQIRWPESLHVAPPVEGGDGTASQARIFEEVRR